jgi:hypothetical protein
LCSDRARSRSSGEPRALPVQDVVVDRIGISGSSDGGLGFSFPVAIVFGVK